MSQFDLCSSSKLETCMKAIAICLLSSCFYILYSKKSCLIECCAQCAYSGGSPLLSARGCSVPCTALVDEALGLCTWKGNFSCDAASCLQMLMPFAYQLPPWPSSMHNANPVDLSTGWKGSCSASHREFIANRPDCGCSAEFARDDWKHRWSFQEGQRLRDVSLHRASRVASEATGDNDWE